MKLTMPPPLLSLIITAHNSECYLAATLKSVLDALGCALPRCEFVITNDNSSDGSQEIIERFAASQSDCKIFTTQFGNIGKVRNFAVAQCRGEYILMVDGDDLLQANQFGDKLRILEEQHPELLISKLIEIKENGPVPEQPTVAFIPLSQDDSIQRYLIHRDFQAHVIGQFIRRDILLNAPFPEFTCYEDSWVFPVLLMQCQKVLFSRSGFYLYIKRPGSLSGKINAEKISYLYQTLENMERTFPARFTNLIACHWLDFFNRHRHEIANSIELDNTKKRIRKINKLAFLLDMRIRLSFKRKFLKNIGLART